MNLRNTLSRIAGLFFCLLLFVVVARAQNQAAIQGTVMDPNGGAIAGATVTVTDQATGVARQAVTTAEGFYRISQIPPGAYTVTVEAKGFKKSVTADVQVNAELVRGLDVNLAVGDVSESVQVNGSIAPALQTEDANITGTLTTQEMERLPMMNRDPYELLRLAPGVFGDGARLGNGLSAGFPNGPGNNGGSGGTGGSNVAIFQTENQQPISAAGQRVTANDYTVDGVSVNSLQWGGAAVVTPSPDSIQQITVLSNDYDATDGRNSGAHIKVVTRGGTNTVHGDGFFQYEEPGLNAFNKYGGFNPGSGFAPPVRNDDAFRQFGAALGGPVIKDKLFFFFDYEGLRDKNATFASDWVETPQFDQLLASVRSGTPVATTVTQAGVAPRINQPLTTTCALWIAANQPCAVVTGGIDIGSPYSTYGTYNPSFTSGNSAQFAGGGLDGIPDLQFAQILLPQTQSGDQYNARMDYTRGRNTFSANTFLTYYYNNQADGAAMGRPNADYKSKRLSPSGFLSWVSTISPNWLNEARFNFTRWGFNDISANPQINWAIPRTEIQGLPTLGGQRILYGAQRGDTSPAVFAQNTFAFRDMLSHVMGTHAFRFGAEVIHYQNNSDLFGSDRPDYVFQGPWNLANGTPIFEAIDVSPVTGGPAELHRYYREGDVGVFFQDDWKFRPNLTLNLGLRWDYFGPPSEAKGNLENVIPGSGPSGLLNAIAVRPSQMYHRTWRNFGPRIGFAWSPTRFQDKAVVRGGFGIAYNRFDDDSFDNTRNNPPLVANYGLCCGTASGEFGSPFLNGQISYNIGTSNSPFSYPANPALATGIDPNTGLALVLPGQGAPDVYSNPVNMPVPYVYLYSLQAQYALPRNWVATVGYQGSSSHDLLRIINLKYFYPTAATEINNVYTFTPDTTANFNALLTQLQHTFRGGLLLNLSYTYSKSIDEVSAEGPGFTTNQTYPLDLATERGPSDFDATHYLRAYGLWNIPILEHSNDWMGKVLGGWQLNGMFEFHSGFPWTPVASNVCPVLGASNLCPLRPTGYTGGAGHRTDTNAFLPQLPNGATGTPVAPNFPQLSTATPGATIPYFTLQTSGSSPAFPGIGRNSFRGPRYSDIDFSVVKQFGLPAMKAIGEGAKLELRANVYNAFNKLNLAPFTFGSTSTTISSCCGSNIIPNPMFGIATNGLQGRVVELQGRFSF